MGSENLRRIRQLGMITGFAGIVALLAVAMHWPLHVEISALVITGLSGFLIVLRASHMQQRIEQASNAVGSFIRGSFDARVNSINALDGWGKFQHRLNNLLDIVDLIIRKGEAAVDTGEDEVYVNKLTSCPLYSMLRQQSEMPVLEIPAQMNINPLVTELESLRQTAQEMQMMSRDLIARADQAPPHTNWARSERLLLAIRHALDHAKTFQYTIKNMHNASEKIGALTTLIDQLAIKSDLVAVNTAISAAHDENDVNAAPAVSAMRLLANDARAASAQATRAVDETRTANHEAMKIIYEIASLIQRMSEIALEAERSGAANNPDESAWVAEARQALVAADLLHEHTTRLDDRLKQLSEAA